MSNGNKFQQETDYVGVGKNPIRFVRTYNSLAGYSLFSQSSPNQLPTIMGKGWSATYFQYLLPVTITDASQTYNAIYAYRPDGRVLTFTQYGGTYSPDGDVADSVAQTPSGGWQYQTADDTIETYEASGRLVSIATRGQAPITVNYAAGSSVGDVPVSVSDPFGHSLQFTYVNTSNPSQQLASITDPAGKVVGYTYDSNQNLTKVTQTDGTTRVYGYGATGNSHSLTTLTDEANVVYASWSYDSSASTCCPPSTRVEWRLTHSRTPLPVREDQ